MRTKVWASMDGVPIYALDDRIILQSVEEQEPQISLLTHKRAGGYGGFISGEEETERDVRVVFAVDERDPVERMRVINKVALWARGNWLGTSYRLNQRLRVKCTGMPTPSKGIDKWTESMVVSFKAALSPRWESVYTSSVNWSGSGSTSAIRLIAPGNCATPMTFRITGRQDHLRVMVNGGDYFDFTSLGMTNNSDWIEASYTDSGVLVIRKKIGSNSPVFAVRGTASADELMLKPGENTIHVNNNSSYTMSCVFSCIGRWY